MIVKFPVFVVVSGSFEAQLVLERAPGGSAGCRAWDRRRVTIAETAKKSYFTKNYRKLKISLVLHADTE